METGHARWSFKATVHSRRARPGGADELEAVFEPKKPAAGPTVQMPFLSPATSVP
jgi:hypothetical protein